MLYYSKKRKNGLKFRDFQGHLVGECVTDKHLGVNVISDVLMKLDRSGFHIIDVVFFCFLVLGTNFAIKKFSFNYEQRCISHLKR